MLAGGRPLVHMILWLEMLKSVDTISLLVVEKRRFKF